MSSAWDDFENVCVSHGHVVMHEPSKRLYAQEPVYLKNQGGYVDRYYAVDCGVDHPQVTLEFYDTGDVIYVTREDVWDSHVTMVQRTDAQYAAALQKMMVHPGCQVIIPPEAASYHVELTNGGIWVTLADNAVSEGIHTVSTLLSKRKVIINRDMCPRLCKAIPAYSWDPKAAKLGNEEPLKVNDDEMDALRYGLHGKITPWRVASGA